MAAWLPLACCATLVVGNTLCHALNGNSWLWQRCAPGRTAFFFASGTATKSQPQEFWAFDVLDPCSVVTSYFLGPWGLLLLHGITAIYMVAVMLVDQIVGGYLGDDWMTFYTHWSVILLSVAGIIGFGIQARYLYYASKGACCRCAPMDGEGLPNIHKDADCHADTLPGDHVKAQDAGGTATPVTPTGAPSRIKKPRGLSRLASIKAEPEPIPVDESQSAALLVGPLSTDGAFLLRSRSSRHHRAGGGTSEEECNVQQDEPVTATCIIDVLVGDAEVSAAAAKAACQCGARQGPKWDVWSISYCLAMQTAAVSTLLLVIIYWSSLAGGTRDPTIRFSPKDPYPYMKHLVNLVLVLLEVFLTKLPMVSVHFQLTLVYTTVYSGVLWVVGEASGTYRYKLDWHSWITVVGVVLLHITLFLTFMIWYAVAAGRDMLGEYLASAPEALSDLQSEHGVASSPKGPAMDIISPTGATHSPKATDVELIGVSPRGVLLSPQGHAASPRRAFRTPLTLSVESAPMSTRVGSFPSLRGMTIIPVGAERVVVSARTSPRAKKEQLE